MAFNSLEFLVFFALVVALYYASPPRYRWALLLVASYYFYAAWAVEYLIWIAVSTLLGYVLALQIARTSRQGRRKALLALGIASNLGLLFAVKYARFFSDSLGALLGRFNVLYHVPAFQILLPVGISFYTFQTLSYLIDVYRGQKEPERHVGIFALYVSFFPQLVAGPIERAGRLLPQLRTDHRPDPARVSDGLRLMLWGLFQKAVIADRLAVYVNAVYDHPADHQGMPVILATYFCAIQIYCDFAGYTDIALGAAKVMGYDLTGNFRQPYLATSVGEFWRRWHISLSTWFRDYLYIPLGGNRVPRWRWSANLMIVFLVSGLWHGASWTFVLWGALHGFYRLLEGWTQRARAGAVRVLRLDNKPAVQTILSVFVTFNLVCFAWIFFRANSIADAFLLVRNLVQVHASTAVYAPWQGIAGDPALQTAFALALVALLAGVQAVRSQRVILPPAIGQRIWVRWATYLVLTLAIMNLGIAREAPFIYVQF